MRFAAAPEYHVFPTLERPLKPYEAVVRAARDTRPLVAEVAPDAVVADILTLAPGARGRARGRAASRRSSPTSTRAARRASRRTRSARACRAPRAGPAAVAGDRPRRRERPRARARASSTRPARRLGLPPLEPRPRRHLAGRCASSATFPQLEYPRALAGRRPTSSGRCCGSRRRTTSSCRAGDEPLVLVAPSTSQDRAAAPAARRARGPGRTCRCACSATPTAARSSRRSAVPANARLVDWVSYARTMPRCDVVVCHAGHGTLARALQRRVRPGRACPRRAT